MFHVEQRVVVVGGGHAGIEAAAAAARLGVPTTLVTVSREWIGRMPCNPAIGGLAKGHLVREIDALGGVMARITDRATLQFKQLNTRKGLAVRGSRAQVDRFRYAHEAQKLLDAQADLDIVLDSVVGIVTEGGRVTGLRTRDHGVLPVGAVIIAAGTFMDGRVIVGTTHYPAGRSGEAATHGLSASLAALGLSLDRLKTGTPPRLLRSSLRWDDLPVQEEDDPGSRFSMHGSPPTLPRIQCRITHTNERTHEVIRRNLDRAPLYDGTIDGVGPRYCPSIEDKIVRFAERPRHQLFLEPEGLHSREIYPNGLSTSLPVDVQVEMVHTIEGLEKAVIVRPGYAIEYDFADPCQLSRTLQVRTVPGLYLAGQVNGTTGYEEAAAQGLLAGINAAHAVKGREPVTLRRDQAYLGVLVDDLVTKGTDEPYRMFTSRAEYRLLLREGNAEYRLSDLGAEIGLLSAEEHRAFQRRRNQVEIAQHLIEERRVQTTDDDVDRLHQRGIDPPRRALRLRELLARPGVELETLAPWLPEVENWPPAVRDELLARVKYAGYIDRQRDQVDRLARTEALPIPPDLDLDTVAGLSHEAREKLHRVRPETLGQASRIPGVTPAAITALLGHIRAGRPTHD